MFGTGTLAKLRAALSRASLDHRDSRVLPRNSLLQTNEQYWSTRNVTHHRRFGSIQESLAHLAWRNDNYYDYIELMPVSGHDEEIILDYGCGPGNDMIGFATYSKPARLIGIDISQPSLREAHERLALHRATAELIKINDSESAIPLADESVDYIHCSGVLMCVPDDLAVLKEFRRILRPDGTARLMVYNYNSIWFHLFAGYIRRFSDPNYWGKTTREVFFESTDWPNCPTNRVWTVDEFTSLCQDAAFSCKHLGNAVAVREVEILPKRFAAIMDERLESEHRCFLLGLTFDDRGVPYFARQAAGIDGCYLLRPR